MMQTNYLSVVALTRELVKGMIGRNRGHIVNMNSIAGKEAYHGEPGGCVQACASAAARAPGGEPARGHACRAGGGIYCASKHALDAYTTACRHELVGTAVRVTSICPGQWPRACLPPAGCRCSCSWSADARLSSLATLLPAARGCCPGAGAARTEFSVVRFKGDVARADAVYEGFDPLTAADIADNVMYAVTR